MSYQASTAFMTQHGLHPTVQQFTDELVRLSFVEDEEPMSVASLSVTMSNEQFDQLVAAVAAWVEMYPTWHPAPGTESPVVQGTLRIPGRPVGVAPDLAV